MTTLENGLPAKCSSLFIVVLFGIVALFSHEPKTTKEGGSELIYDKYGRKRGGISDRMP